MMERIKKFYIPINRIPEIESDIIEYIEMEERAFMEQLLHDDFLFTVVRDLFADARTEKCTIDDEYKSSLVMMITQNLSRRADRCCELVKQVKKREYTELEVIGKVEK